MQYDDGARGLYSSIYTLSPEVVVNLGIERGCEYRTRYRAMNFNGWGDYSELNTAGATIETAPATVITSIVIAHERRRFSNLRKEQYLQHYIRSNC